MKYPEAQERFAALGPDLRVPAAVAPLIERRYIELAAPGGAGKKRLALAWVATYRAASPREIAIDDRSGEIVRDRS